MSANNTLGINTIFNRIFRINMPHQRIDRPFEQIARLGLDLPKITIKIKFRDNTIMGITLITDIIEDFSYPNVNFNILQ